jgi:hypothetical protein
VTDRPFNDDLLTLAFSLHANPGAYALLIGAGASYSSGIPVAWDVLVDLCRKLARAEQAELGEEAPEAWYERTRGEEPTYGRPLERLAKTLGATPGAAGGVLRGHR